MSYKRPHTLRTGLVAVIACLACGPAWAEDPEVTMEVIEDPHAQDLSRSHSLQLPSAAGDAEGARGREGRGPRQSKPDHARDAAREAREHAREAEQVRQDREQLPEAARDNRPDGSTRP
jgi:hypothetical protein